MGPVTENGPATATETETVPTVKYVVSDLNLSLGCDAH
jgi:hypothetical protein